MYGNSDAGPTNCLFCSSEATIYTLIDMLFYFPHAIYLHVIHKLRHRNLHPCLYVVVFSQLRPPMMTSLLRELVLDVPALNENTIVPLRVSETLVLLLC